MGDAPTSTPPKPSSRIVLPSLAELERQQAEEDAEDLEIFWEPKKRKLTGMWPLSCMNPLFIPANQCRPIKSTLWPTFQH